MHKITKQHLNNSHLEADVCLIIEGNYPYISGGVSAWIHDMIQAQSDLTFHIVTILAPDTVTKPRYSIPTNIISVTNIFLQELPKGSSSISNQDYFFSRLEKIFIDMFHGGTINNLRELIDNITPYKSHLGYKVLQENESVWNLIQRMYSKLFPAASFVDFFWIWRSIYGGLFSILLSPMPKAKMYHALCTGFAGLYGARATIETGKKLLLTEHGIYTNERRIELGVAQTIHDLNESDISTSPDFAELRDLWTNMFSTYSKICYEASHRIVTLFKENQIIQQIEGADKSKVQIIPNGVQVSKYSSLEKKESQNQPTIALIGRIVPIKGIKTFITACQIIKDEIPALRAVLLGSVDEDPAYYVECKSLVKHLGLNDTVEFLEEVQLVDYLPTIDLLVLSSVSEAQPLVVLEAGAAGIPAVVTNVGSCRDLIYGLPEENPNLGSGGAVVNVSDALGIAREVITLLKNKDLRLQCGRSIQKRMKTYYNSESLYKSYKVLYSDLIRDSDSPDSNHSHTFDEQRGIWQE